MIDIHAHILPETDDGPTSLEETYNILKEVEEAGFKKIISTSHYKEGIFEKNEAERKIIIDEINKRIDKLNDSCL